MDDEKKSPSEKKGFGIGLVEDEIKSFTLDVNTGAVAVNGIEVKNVSEIYLQFKDGRYSLRIERTDLLKATSL